MTRNIASRRVFHVFGLFAALLALSGCGFKPIYATTSEDGAPALVHRIAVQTVNAPSTDLETDVTRALENRMALAPGVAPQYLLNVNARASAIPLAVQIDATTTRFNYRLSARYQLIDADSGATIRGSAAAITSFNIVTSQYSNLAAENTAREKASRLLAVEIERDILLRIASSEAKAAEAQDEEQELEAPPDPLGDFNPDTEGFSSDRDGTE